MLTWDSLDIRNEKNSKDGDEGYFPQFASQFSVLDERRESVPAHSAVYLTWMSSSISQRASIRSLVMRFSSFTVACGNGTRFLFMDTHS